jgi:eukaryotic-like serine/threonine-protein kinase
LTRPSPELDETCSIDGSPRRELVDVLERYMADLERGVVPDQQAILKSHPELAAELGPYLDSLRLLDGATRDLRVAKITAEGEVVDNQAPKKRRIGEYQIVREIGRGGMGIVYEAHQESLNRQVALKVLPFAAVLDQRQVARFRNEAQAAAQLHHPNIVPVFAVGQEQGIYYYAMQYIAGQSLDQAISDLRLKEQPGVANTTKARGAANGSTTTLHNGAESILAHRYSPERGEFFRTVARLGREAAEALQHAHENGIIHRDIKPSNLMIDSHGKLWITDFGLARIQTGNGVTLTGDVIGTLRYMSPEQTSGSAVVDGRTDIYSLGVTLYELLTQKLAHPSEDRKTLLRQILEDEPIAPRKLNPAMPQDLENIVLSAMAKARDDRYSSAQLLADDLERFLDGKPTLARRPTMIDRAGKWARRHRSLVAIAACAVVSLSLVSATGLVLLAREQRRTSAALSEAQQNLGRAQKHFDQAYSAVTQFGINSSDRLNEIPGTEDIRDDLLFRSLDYYRQFAKDAGDDPQLREQTALAHFKSAVASAKLELVDEAINEYKSCQAILIEVASNDPKRADVRVQLAISHNNLGLLYAKRAEPELAQQEYARAIAIHHELVAEDAKNPQFVVGLAESEANLAMLLDQTGQSEAAEKALRAAINILRPMADSSVGNDSVAHSLAVACNNLSFVMRSRDASAAENASKEAIAILERLESRADADVECQNDLALCFNNLAALKSQKGDWRAAIDSHWRAIELQEQMVRKSPLVVRYRSDLAVSLNNIGVAHCREKNAAEADAAFTRARELFAELSRDYPNEPYFQTSLAAQLNNQALALAEMGDHAEALPIYRAAIAAQQKCCAQSPSSDVMRELLSKMHYNFGKSLSAERRWRDAFDTAVARQSIWNGNSERLLGVAAELADLCQAFKENSAAAADDQTITDAELVAGVLSALQTAYDSGWPRLVNPSSEERFASLKTDPFATKIAEFNRLAVESGSAGMKTSAASPGNTN